MSDCCVSPPASIETVVEPPPVIETVLEAAQGLPGPPGPPGPSGGGSGLQHDFAFAWGDASPMSLGTFVGTVVGVSIVITQPFDGAGAALAVRQVGGPLVLMAEAESLPGEVGRYDVAPAIHLAAATPLEFVITPGLGASSGSGLILLEIGS
jgi:hypothetical protein